MSLAKALDALLQNKNFNIYDGKFTVKLGVSRLALMRKPSYSIRYNGKYAEVVKLNNFRWCKRVMDVFIVPEDEPNPHVLIVGMSGFGKSSLLKSIIVGVQRAGKGIIVFDAHDEHENIVRAVNGTVFSAADSGINLLDLSGETVGERISGLTNLFRSVFSLGYVQTTKLGECLWYTYRKCGAASRNDRHISKTPTLKELLAEISIFVKNARNSGEMHTLMHLRNRLALLSSSAFLNSTLSIDGVIRGVSSFSLSRLRSREAQMVYIGELLRRLYATMKDNAKESGLNLYIILDEAQFLINSSEGRESVVNDLIGEGRKYGVGVIIATHNASSLSKRIVSNASTFIAFFSREPTETNYVANLLAGGSADAASMIKERIKVLKQNEAIVVNACVREPTVVETPRFDAVELPVNDNYSKRASALEFAHKPVLESELVGYGEELVKRLVSTGELDGIQIEWNGKKERWYMKHSTSLSVEHEVLVRKIALRLSDLGISNVIRDGPYSPDLVVHYNGWKIAVEYETGKKHMHASMQMFADRGRVYDSVLVVVNDKYFKRYKKFFETDLVHVMKFGSLNGIKTFLDEIVAHGKITG